MTSKPDDKYDYSISAEEKVAAQKFFSSTEFKELDRKLSEVKEPSKPEQAGLQEAMARVSDELGSAVRMMAYQEDTTGETNAAFTDAEDELLQLFEATAKEVITKGKPERFDVPVVGPNQGSIAKVNFNNGIDTYEDNMTARLAALLRGERS